MTRKALVIAAPSSGAGKTTITLALLRLLKRRGYKVAAYKTGPDFIDPSYHHAAITLALKPMPAISFDALARVSGCNLDPWSMNREQLKAHYALAQESDWSIIEGVMGLYDASISTQGSSADLAIALDVPVALVLDCSKQGQSIAALAKGFLDYAPKRLRFAGFILNNLGSERHEAMIRAALAPLSLPILASLPKAPALKLASRHLGLHQAFEHEDLEQYLNKAADWLEQGLDFQALELGAQQDKAQDKDTAFQLPLIIKQEGIKRVALAYDAAFSFFYAHHAQALKAQGIEVLPFSPLANQCVPDGADMVWLVGGYPELFAKEIAHADQTWSSLRACVARGAWVWAECGGYMAIGSELIDRAGQAWPMAGLLPHRTSFAQPKRTLGYRQLHSLVATPFGAKGQTLFGHEFHYSQLIENENHLQQGKVQPLFALKDAAGQDLGWAGSAEGRVQDSYIHVI